MSSEIVNQEGNSNKQEFIVPIVLHSYGYVKVSARDKNEAKGTVESMNLKRVLQYFKPQYEFLDVGDVVEPSAEGSESPNQ